MGAEPGRFGCFENRREVECFVKAAVLCAQRARARGGRSNDAVDAFGLELRRSQVEDFERGLVESLQAVEQQVDASCVERRLAAKKGRDGRKAFLSVGQGPFGGPTLFKALAELRTVVAVKAKRRQ